MYFPYLRGRQFELIAIRELAEKNKLSKLIIPIIEPVKLSATITSTISACEKSDNRIAVISNPQVGSLYADAKKDKSGKKLDELRTRIIKSSAVINTVLASKYSKSKYDELVSSGVDPEEIIAIFTDRDYISDYEEVFNRQSKYCVVPYDPSFRRIRGERIMISDRFAVIKKERNNDYAKNEDEFFSDDHLYYAEDGYAGFSDYSIVGQAYQESGFAPYAVAIHIVYFNEKNELRIHHFVSESNDDISDPANKFYEAVSKLVEWNKTIGLHTEGIHAFEEMHSTGAYPGLGVVKKLSIMHHIELMGDYLEEAKK
ncbi:MAG: sce7725 family protein [Eubacteriales bacterium]|nr:sce7725 family protein [Eubacteriales bacterium]